MRKIVLASTSPRRRELLEKLRIPFTVEESGYEEDMSLPLRPRDLVKLLALEKAKSVALRHGNAVVIGGDTIVVHGTEVLGKPKTRAAARQMLRTINGKELVILTGVALIDTKTGKHVARVAEARVQMRPFSEKEIRSYVATDEPLDKAGAFAIQGYGAALIRSVTGDFFGVVGLPLAIVRDELENMGVRIG